MKYSYKPELNKNELPVLDRIVYRLSEATKQYFDPERRIFIGLNLFVDTTSNKKSIERVLGYLDKYRFIDNLSEIEVDISKDKYFDLKGIKVSSDFSKDYKGYEYILSFPIDKYPIDRLIRFRLISTLIIFGVFEPKDIPSILNYERIPINSDLMGSDSLVEFEEELDSDLDELERLKVIGNNISGGEGFPQSDLIAMNHSKLNLRRFQLLLDTSLWNSDKTERDNTVVMEIKFTLDGKVVLNDSQVISNPNFGSENEELIEFLVANPNKRYRKSELEENGIKVGKDFNKIVENLGFKNELRKIFWDVSKDMIRLRNPITKADLEDMGMEDYKPI